MTMQVLVENTGELGRRLTVTVPAEKVRSALETATREITKTAKVDGFRPGKIPSHMISKKYKQQIRQETLSQIIENTLPEAMQEKGLEPAGRPNVERVLNFQEGQENKDLEYVVSFEVFPEFVLPDFSQIKVEKYQVDITESDVEKTFEKLKSQFVHWKIVNREAKIGDRLIVDYTSTLNGKPYENSSGQDIQVELGTKIFLEGFETGLLGAKVGESRTLDLQFPTEWRMEKLAGKPVKFIIKVKAVEEKQPATLEEISKKVGADKPSLEAIYPKVRENLERQIAHLIDENLKKKVLDALLALCPITLPEALIQNEMAVLHEDLHRRVGDKAHDTCQHQGLEAEASRRVTLSLLLRNLVKLEKLAPNEDQVRQKVSEIAKSFGNAEFIENMYYESEELISGVRNTVLVDQAIDLILTKAVVTPKQISVDDLFKREP